MARRKTPSRRARPAARAVAPQVGSRLAATFRAVTQTLDELGVRYAVIGGLAVGVRVEPRTTKDIDFAVSVASDDEAEALIHALRQHGYSIDSVFERTDGRLATVRTVATSRVLIDYLFGSSRIEPEIVEEAEIVDIAGVKARVAQPWHLLAMKIKAGRDRDAADIDNLLRDATPAMLARAQRALALMHQRGADPGRNLIAELNAALARQRRRDSEFEPVTGARLARLRGASRKPRR